MISNIIDGFLIIISFNNILSLLFGFILGLSFGIIPGLNSITAVLLVLPFAFGRNPESVFILLVAAYCAALYGGSVPAILFNTPGTSSAMMTSLDGYPLAKEGRAGEALAFSAIASGFGSIFGAICLLLFTPWLAEFALSFGPFEYFSLTIFGMSAVTSLGKGNQIKSFISLLLGIIIVSIGIDSFRGMDRFTFGIDYLLSGFDMVPVLIGIFAISEVFLQSNLFKITTKKSIKVKSFKIPRFSEVLKHWFNLIRSSLIGIIVGVLPGAGATVACAISYNEAQRWSKTPEKFGKGAIEGIIAAESANNTVAGTSMIPTLALGIPGSPTSAALVGAFMIMGLNPGPELIVMRPTLLMAIFWSIFLCGILIIVFGLGVIRFFAKALEISYSNIAPLILLFAMLGTFTIRNNFFDLVVVIIFGLIGYILRKNNFPLIAFTLGFILGPLTESSLLHALDLSGRNLFLFFARPISAILLCLSFLILLYPLFYDFIFKKRFN